MQNIFQEHGDVNVDSHLDLPVINKSFAQLDSLELYPFKKIFAAGVGSVMIAHLNIPAIDTTAHLPTSLSEKNVTDLLRNKLGFTGISFTDALDMKGVTKYFPNGGSAVLSLVAGNDMLCLPPDVPAAIKAIKKSIREKKLNWVDINFKVKKVLLAKYNTGLNKIIPVDIRDLTNDLNDSISYYRKKVAEESLTVLKFSSENFLPLRSSQRLAYIGIGANNETALSALLKQNYNADCFYFDYKKDSVDEKKLVDSIRNKYDAIIIGLQNFNKFPANNFGISNPALQLLNEFQNNKNAITFIFGNPYAAKFLCNAQNLIECYEGDAIFQQTAFNFFQGNFFSHGKLPVTVCEKLHAGDGIMIK